MERISYFRVFGFLAFTGSAFLSAVFHYPAFTIFWFIVMIIFAVSLFCEESELIVLAFSAIAYIPLGLISVLSNYLSKNPPYNDISHFAWTLVAFLIIEFVLGLIWFVIKLDN